MKNDGRKEIFKYQIIIVVFLSSIVLIIGYYVYDLNQFKEEPLRMISHIKIHSQVH